MATSQHNNSPILVLMLGESQFVGARDLTYVQNYRIHEVIKLH